MSRFHPSFRGVFRFVAVSVVSIVLVIGMGAAFSMHGWDGAKALRLVAALVAFAVIATVIGAGFLHAVFQSSALEVSETGIAGRSQLGFRVRFDWRDVHGASVMSQNGITTLIVTSRRSNQALHAPMNDIDREALQAAIRTHAGPDHLLERAVGSEPRHLTGRRG